MRKQLEQQLVVLHDHFGLVRRVREQRHEPARAADGSAQLPEGTWRHAALQAGRHRRSTGRRRLLRRRWVRWFRWFRGFRWFRWFRRFRWFRGCRSRRFRSRRVRSQSQGPGRAAGLRRWQLSRWAALSDLAYGDQQLRNVRSPARLRHAEPELLRQGRGIPGEHPLEPEVPGGQQGMPVPALPEPGWTRREHNDRGHELRDRLWRADGAILTLSGMSRRRHLGMLAARLVPPRAGRVLRHIPAPVDCDEVRLVASGSLTRTQRPAAVRVSLSPGSPSVATTYRRTAAAHLGRCAACRRAR